MRCLCGALEVMRNAIYYLKIIVFGYVVGAAAMIAHLGVKRVLADNAPVKASVASSSVVAPAEIVTAVGSMGIPMDEMSGIPALAVDSVTNDYIMLQVDKDGRVIFKCKDCPNKFCKEMACKMKFTESGEYKATCECRN